MICEWDSFNCEMSILDNDLSGILLIVKCRFAGLGYSMHFIFYFLLCYFVAKNKELSTTK